MLKQRLITGFTLAGFAVIASLWLPNPILATILLSIVLLGGWEWARLTGLATTFHRILYLLIICLTAYLAWFVTFEHHSIWVILAASAWWGGVSVMLAFYHPESRTPLLSRLILQLAGLITLVPAWIALVSLHSQQPKVLLFLFSLIWIADSAAYFTGKQIGKTKLAPALSPGKTREGVWGALLGTVLLGTAGAIWLQLPSILLVYFVGLCLLTTLFSVVGDLFESFLKRLSGVKDSGTILPGHGGILDRIDSVTAAAPVFTLGYQWMQWPQKMPG